MSDSEKGRTRGGIDRQDGYTKYPSRVLYLPRGVERLSSLGVLKSFPKDRVISKQDEMPQYCYVVAKGMVTAYDYSVNGSERIYNLMERNAVLLEANLLMRTPAPVYFRAAVDSDLICIDRENLLNAMIDDPEVNFDIIQSLSIKFLSSMDQIRQSGSYNASWKITNLLLIFADHYGVNYEGKVMIKQKISQQMLSNMLGINRITTVHVIKNLRDMGLIENVNGYYCIRDVEKMKIHLDYC
ncbi:MAG: Crp/Fnr family transcriptional regulator [Deltaproteobacteria bacterium]|jgi:CRP/FNR family transcriptional regulator|nr:Crp/Fnr family transcriptional regulator [Deltaproteobacteria bacterium]